MDGRRNKSLGCSVITVAIQTIIGEFIVSTLDVLTGRNNKKNTMKVQELLKRNQYNCNIRFI
jgi:hypothetical protein